jgi:ABC-type microcin C transport system duplicated ATPase subunit YejF
MTTPLLDVRHLRVEFPTRRGTLLALEDVSFQIAPGEILGVVANRAPASRSPVRPSSACSIRPVASLAARSSSKAAHR